MGQNSSTPTQRCEDVVVIPSNYADEGVVPICIRTVDDEGRRVYRGWIDAVVPIADRLRWLAGHVMGNVHQVSELADGSIHPLSARFGEELGRSPSMRIFVMAKYKARDLAAGGRNARLGLEIGLADAMLDVLAGGQDFAKAYEDQEFLQRLQEELRLAGKKDELKMLRLYLIDNEHNIAADSGSEGTPRNGTPFQSASGALLPRLQTGFAMERRTDVGLLCLRTDATGQHANR